jgi:hypothetical protein
MTLPTTRSRWFAALAGALLLSPLGAQSQVYTGYMEGKWSHTDKDEDKFGGGGGRGLDVRSDGSGGFVGKFDLGNDCKSGTSRDQYITGTIGGTLTQSNVVQVSGKLTRCTDPVLVKKCHIHETYEVPYQGVILVTGGTQGMPQKLTIEIKFDLERWKIPQCKKDSPQHVQVELQLVAPRQPQQARTSKDWLDCIKNQAIRKTLTQNPTPLVDLCR